MVMSAGSNFGCDGSSITILTSTVLPVTGAAATAPAAAAAAPVSVVAAGVDAAALFDASCPFSPPAHAPRTTALARSASPVNRIVERPPVPYESLDDHPPREPRSAVNLSAGQGRRKRSGPRIEPVRTAEGRGLTTRGNRGLARMAADTTTATATTTASRG